MDNLKNRVIEKFKSNEWSAHTLVNTENTPWYWGYKKAIEKCPPNSRSLPDPINIVCDILSKSPTLTTLKKKVLQIEEILGKKLNEPSIIPYISFVIFGSPDSTDIDIAVFINAETFFNNTRATSPDKLRLERLPLDFIDKVKERHFQSLTLSLNKYREKEKEKEKWKGIDYNSFKKLLDLNFVVIDSKGDIEYCFKGDCYETQNIIFYTAKYWNNNVDDLPIKNPIDISLIDPEKKVRAISRLVLDNMEDLCGKEIYNMYRSLKHDIYAKGMESHLLLIKELSKSIRIGVDTSYNCRSTIKSITIKLIQLYLATTFNVLEYDKTCMPDTLSNLDKSFKKESLKSLLNRQQLDAKVEEATITTKTEAIALIDIENRDCLNLLFEKYYEIVESLLIKLEWLFLYDNKGDIFLSGLSLKLSDMKFSESFWKVFIENEDSFHPPDILINAFIKEANISSIDFSLNEIFKEDSYGLEHLPEKFKEDHCFNVAQRSSAWLSLQKMYRCGRNTAKAVIDHSINGLESLEERVKKYWNLIRGCLGEILTIAILKNILPFSKMRFANSNFMVERKSDCNSTGISPDLLLIDNDNYIIPVEMKCLSGFKSFESLKSGGNSALRRETNLGVRQLSKCRSILKDLSRQSLLLVLYIEKNKVCLYGTYIS